MSTSTKPVQHRALLITFENSYLTTAKDQLHKSLQHLNWKIKDLPLSSSDSSQAQKDPDTAVDELVQSVGKRPIDKIIIYFGGYAQKKTAKFNSWTWHS